MTDRCRFIVKASGVMAAAAAAARRPTAGCRGTWTRSSSALLPVNGLKEIAMSHNIAAHRSHQHQAMCGSLDRRTAALLVRPETAERGRAVRVGRQTIHLE